MFKFFVIIIANLHHTPMIISRMRYMIRHRDRIPLAKRYKFAQFVVKTYAAPCGIKTIATGVENLPKEPGYIMFPNHQGKYDIMGLFLAHPTPTSYVMDKDRSHFIMISEILDIVGGKRMDLHSVRQNLSVINEIAEDVKHGTNYIIFSEGGYDYKHNGNRIHEFKPGSFKAATKIKAPIVPVCLIDSYKAFNSWSFKPVTTQVHFLTPIYYDEYKGMKGSELAEMVRQRIVQKMRECGANPD